LVRSDRERDCGQVAHTSCTSVVALVFIEQDGSLLLAKQRYGRCYWSLPGGTMEPGEPIDETARREVKEETGLDIRVGRLVGLYSKPGEAALAVCFAGEVVGGTLRPGHEISQCRFFPYDALPGPVREHMHQRLEDFRSDLPFAVVRTQ
jgi:ADP-ribose pyrophosphatase YjhB (NUDIX family)